MVITLNYFDYYLIGMNFIGFILFTIYMFFSTATGSKSSIFNRIFTVISLLFGSLGMATAMILFGRTPKANRKDTMMSRVFISCILVIQIILVLIVKGYVAGDLTINFWDFFYEHKWVIVYLGIINIITFAMFALDKVRAIGHRTRIRIITLLFLSFVGGSSGGLLAMYIFRHKTKIDYFTVGLPLMIVMQVFILFYVMNII